MMGMGQQMPMRRPPMGPSPMTAGRPNPMAGFQGGGGGGPQQPPPWAQGGMQGMAPWMRPPPPQMPPGGGAGIRSAPAQPPPQQWGGGPAQAMPLLQAPEGMGGPQGYTPWIGGGVEGNNIGGPQGQYDTPQVAYPQGGMSDAQMHPFAPRNRPQFPGAMQGAIQGAMGRMGPQMTQGFQGSGQMLPPGQQMMPPWMQRRFANAIPL